MESVRFDIVAYVNLTFSLTQIFLLTIDNDPNPLSPDFQEGREWLDRTSMFRGGLLGKRG